MSAQLVSTSTSNQALDSTIGAKVIVAADGTALVVYYTGSAMAFRYASSPYSSWSSATTLPGSGSSRYGAAVHYNSSDDSVDVVYHVSGGLATYVKLSKSGSTYSAGTQHTVVAAGGSGSSGEAVWIGKDGSGRLWVVCLQTNTTWEAYYSNDGGSTWTASITGATMGGNSVDQPVATIAGNYLLVCYSKNNGNLAWRRLDTTGTLTSGFWSAEQTTPLGVNPDFYAGDFMSMATDGSGRAIFVMSSQGFNFASGVWAKVYTPGSDSWGSDTHLGATTGANGDNYGVAVSNGTDVWAVYCHGIASNNFQLVYKKWSNGGASWDGSATQLEASGNNITFPQGFAGSSALYFAYTQGTASPWSVYFDSLSTASHVSHTSSGALAQVKKTNLHTSSGALAQIKRFGVQHTSSGALAQVTRGAGHTSSGALAQLQAHVAHTASAVLANVKKTTAHSSSKAVAQIAKIPPLAPVISRSQPSYASGGSSASLANDGDYGTVWLTGTAPTGVAPAIWAVDLSSIPAAQRHQVVLAWYTETADGYWQPTPVQYYNVPKDYTIETNTSPGGSYPPGGVWTPVVSVSNNVYWAREHAFDLSGANWVRIVVTASNGSAGNNGVRLQVDIHDASRGDVDDWLKLGDSITAEAEFRGNPDGSAWTNGPLAQQVNTANPTFFPLIVDGGYGGMTMGWGATNIASLLAPFTGRYVSIGFGTNDLNVGFQQSQSQLAAIYANLLTILDAIVAAGKIPVVPYVMYGTNNSFYLGINAQQFNAYVDAHLPTDRAGQYLRGPDLWTAFYQNPSLLRDGIHPTFAANPDGTQTGYDLYHRVWRDWMLATIYATPHQSHVSSGARAQITRADGKLHSYHTSSGATAVIAFPTHHQSTGARAQLKKNTKHTSSAALAQVKAHATHSSTGALVNVKQHSAHTSSAALAQLSKRVGHPSPGALANVKKTTLHTSSGARAQVSAAGHATHTSTGALAQLKQRTPHTASAALVQVKRHNLRTSASAIAHVKQHASHSASGMLANVKQHASHSASGALANVKQRTAHTSSAALANVKRRNVSHTSSAALAQIHHTDVLHVSTGALAQISTAGHATHTASGALAQVKQHVRHSASAALAQVKQHNTHSSASAVVLVKRRGITRSASGMLVQVTRTPVHQSTGALAQLRAHRERNSVGALAQVKRQSVQHKASGMLAQIALPPLPVATGVTLILSPIAAGSPVEL